MIIGIFDSGIGGEALAHELQKTFPSAKLTIANDKSHLPYGDKTQTEVTQLTNEAIQPLLAQSCDVIVIACNTASTLTIDNLRETYPNQLFIGIEPMVKTASTRTKSKVIAVCATPATLASHRYAKLVKKYAAHLTLLEPDCSEWAYMIENNLINKEKIAEKIEEVCREGADVIVLGCTHYHWIKDLITQVADGRAQVLEPSEAIGRRVKHLLGV